MQEIEYTPDNSTNHQQNTVSLDALGPVVVNSDGSISRINNWVSLSEEEKARIMRILPARNAKRLAELNAETK